MKENKVYVIQEIAGSQAGSPKINIVGATEYGDLKFLLPEFSQMIFSPGPLVRKLRQGLKDFTEKDYLLLVIIMVSEVLHKFHLQERLIHHHLLLMAPLSLQVFLGFLLLDQEDSRLVLVD